MKRLVLIAIAALTLWAGSAFAGGRVYVYTSGGGYHYRPYRSYYYGSYYYQPRRYYSYSYPRYYRTYYRPYYRPYYTTYYYYGY
jgi:hypothetical protein